MSDADTPKKKRTLERKCEGKDVQAVQRALQAGLRAKGQKTVLSVTGTFGEGTETDVATWQRCNGIDASGSMGQPTLDSLWPYFDDYGVSLYYRAKLGKPTKLGEPIKKGAKGDRVRAAQQAFWRMLGSDTSNARNSVFGDGLQDDLRLFAKRTDQDISTDRISQGTWDCVWAFMDEYAMNLANAAAKDDSGASSTGAIRSNLVNLAEDYVRHSGDYLQNRPYDRGKLVDNPQMRGDCSGSIHRLFQLAGGPDPSGNGFNGAGYTGTMQSRGKEINLSESAMVAGDCLFYGDQGGGVAAHVELYLGSGRQFGFGGTPPTMHSFAGYWRSGLRHDIGARRYFG